ncbi:hypothetical protein AVEN_109320-1 [Araneus ventricosus]|uniref:Uncharacterized protein n=1 Tax=Araneus ventricosus TaxID=182803 RepID=A0A4Y2D1H5_ARAVE|nr:hypothetical protein AVEN_109320-1 [Araneus ventricosus]
MPQAIGVWGLGSCGISNLHVDDDDDPRRSAELYQVHEPEYPKEIQSQQRIRNKILFGKPQACKNMITCGRLE